MSSSAQLEQEAEQTRSELARRLDELRERITPGQLVDQAVDYAKDTTGGEFFRNLSRQVAANPLPVALIGAGIGWLALAKGNSGAAGGRVTSGFGRASDEAQASAVARGAGERVSEWSAQAGDRANEAASQAADIAGTLGDGVSAASDRAKSTMADAGAAVGEGAASAYGSMKSSATDAANRAGNAAADAYDRFADTAGRTGSAIAQSASGAREKIASFGTDALAFCKDQPLVVAGLGLVLGAVLGTIIPSTDAEDRLMGDASDRIKDQAHGAAEEQIEKVKTVVEDGLERAPAQAEHLANSVGEAATTTLVPQEEDSEAKLPLE